MAPNRAHHSPRDCRAHERSLGFVMRVFLDDALTLASGREVCALGALAIGDIKYKVHTALLQQMYETDTPVYLAHDEAFATARDIVAQQKKA